MESNAEIRLVKKPSLNYPKTDQTIFQLRKTQPISKNQVPQGHALVQTRFISIDAANRVWISGFKSYRDPILPGDRMLGGVAGKVIHSNGKLKAGDWVIGQWGWTDYAIVNEKQVKRLPENTPNPQKFLGVFGISGLTAYIGLVKIGKPKKGDTVLVSAAAGACGQIVVQLAKSLGCQVVGIAGSDQKCRYVQSIGARSCINYNKLEDGSLEATIKKHCPKGADIYFDNVGGQTLDAALMNIKEGSRLVLCGSISTYYGRTEPYKLKNYPRLIIKKCTMEGFIFTDHKKEFPEALQYLMKLDKNGQLKSRIDWSNGLKQCPNALRKLLLGKNNGKVMVNINQGVNPKL